MFFGNSQHHANPSKPSKPEPKPEDSGYKVIRDPYGNIAIDEPSLVSVSSVGEYSHDAEELARMSIYLPGMLGWVPLSELQAYAS